jgi:hypothetical protein
MWARTRKQAMEAAEGARVAELEADNTRLVAELEQTCLALIEADVAQNLLSVNHAELEEDCAWLHTAVDTLTREKA